MEENTKKLVRISRGGCRRGETSLVAVECFSDVGDGHMRTNGTYGRRRKFSNPLFLSPAGFMRSYSEKPDELFLDVEQAAAALQSQAQPGEWEIRETSLEAELRSKRYLR